MYKPTHCLSSQKLPNFFATVIFAFSIVAIGFSETGLLPPAVVVLLGTLLIYLGPAQIILLVSKLPVELKLLNAWMLFAFFTGYFVAIDHLDFFDGMRRVFFYIMISNVVAVLVMYHSDSAKFILWGVLIAGIIHVIAVHLGFGLDYSERTGREVGLNSNPNSLGLKMVYASFALLFILMAKKFNVFRILICSIFLFAFIEVILLSGSRKSLLTFLLLVGLFVPLCIVKRYKTNVSTLIISGIALVIASVFLYLALPTFIEGTAVGERLNMGVERGGVQGDIRHDMYLFAVGLMADSPFFGVGMNNFRSLFWTGQYSHSDYAESLSSTGLLGFLLYQVVYLIVIIRGLSVFVSTGDVYKRQCAAMAVIAIIMLKVLGTGVILFYSPAPLMILALFSVITIKIKYERSTPREAAGCF